MNTHEILRERLLVAAKINPPPNALQVYESLRRSEWSTEFENRMRNRLIMGAIRYGKLGWWRKPKYDRVASIIKRLELYRQTGNREYLVDCANLALVEYVEGNHPKKHFKSADDDGVHVTT